MSFGGVSSGSAMGKKAFRRAPVTDMPAKAGMGSAMSIRTCLTWTAGSPGATARSRAAAPATCGVAIEVPPYVQS